MTPRAGEGNPSARLMVVGEAWGDKDERYGVPFAGPAGDELNRMLAEVGVPRNQVYTTNVVNARPPWSDIERWIPKRKKDVGPNFVPFRDATVAPIVRDGFHQLLREIHLVKPDIILALGNTALWALTGAKGILKWRGSQLTCSIDRSLYPQGLLGPTDSPWSGKLIPSLHPSTLLRQSDLRSTVLIDFRRAVREIGSKEYSNVPSWKFIVRPSLEVTLSTLATLQARAEKGPDPLWLDFDLETRAGHIACAGISWSLEEAICIPFMCVEARDGYWLVEEEAQIVYRLYKLLTHPNVRVRGQNLLYDCQYTYRHWCFVPRVAQDTMISHHSAYCGLPKSLAFQASMYCDHYVYWKEDGKTWEAAVSEDQLWRYNAIDCVRTREVGEASARVIQSYGLQPVDDFQQRFFWHVLRCMQRGVRIDKTRRQQFAETLMVEIAARERYFSRILGHPLNPRSNPQMTKLFYDDLGQRKIYKPAKPGAEPSLTCDDHALTTIGEREPLLLPLLRRIAEYRSLGVFLSTFVLAPLDIDGRMRTSYNICGTETYRFSSSENAFGSGTNLQNIPAGGDDAESGLSLPNIRTIFVPDPGFTIFDTDLSKADLRIVAWEADEGEMKAMLKEGRDPYIETAREFYHDPTINKKRPDSSDDPKYKTFKSFSHGTHYLGTPIGLARRLGLTVREAEATQKWYFGRYPRIKLWQRDFCSALQSRRYVQNIFGYRRYYFGRIDEDTFRQAIAWLPQSTVALYINRIWAAIMEDPANVDGALTEILLQVHDSLVGQFPTYRAAEARALIDRCAKIVLPYSDPLIIPIGIKTSEKSWGDCK